MTFSEAEIQAIKDAFNSWSVQCSGVTWTFKTGAHTCTTCFDFSSNYVSVTKDLIPLAPDGSPVLAVTSKASNGIALHHAQMRIDVRITDAIAFKKTVVHEVGHTFGLRHCVVALGGGVCGSAMDNSSNYNDTVPGFTAATACDLSEAKAAGNYQCGGGGGGEETCLELWCNGGEIESGCATSATTCGCPPGTTPSQTVWGCCCGATPLLIDIEGDGYRLTNWTNGVHFERKSEVNFCAQTGRWEIEAALLASHRKQEP